MYCRNCGKELTDDTNYCPHCGSKVEDHKDKDCAAGGKSSTVAESARSASGSVDNDSKPDTHKKSPVKVIVLFTILVLAIIVGITVALTPPSGALDETFQCSIIEPSEEAQESNIIKIPFIEDYGIDTAEYEEYGSLGLESADDSLKGGSTRLEIKCNKDNSFEIHFYDNYSYGEYYYDKANEEITFYVDDAENTAFCDGDTISIYSDDGSRFEFK